MTLQFSVQSDIDKTIKQVGRFYAKQVPFATSVALNETATEVRAKEQRAIVQDLDNPTPQTVKGIRMFRSSKRKLTAGVFIIPHIDKFMRYQIHGGTRPPRSKTEAVPVQVRLNKYGNIPGRRQGKLGKLINRPDTFSGTIKGVAGIWQRGKGRNRHRVTLLVAYEPRTRYKKRFDFYGHAQTTASKRWPRNFDRALKHAIRTAR